MGVVYRAHDTRLHRNVALKLVAPDLADSDRFRDQFLHESELAASLEHPNVVPVYAAGTRNGRLYLAMRYVDGPSLRSVLRAEGPLPPARALLIARQIASALDAAHARGLVHRDVKPSNVLLDAHAHAYLADFGLTGRLVDDGPFALGGHSLGTPAYASPEQIEGAATAAYSDVYSLACLLFECLTGEPPFPRESRLAVVWAHLEENPPRASERNPELPAEVDAVLRKGLAKAPEERHGSAGELVAAATQALGVGEAAGGRSRRRVLVGALALVFVGATTAAVTRELNRNDATAAPGLTLRWNTVVRIDPGTNVVSAVVDVGHDPTAVAAAGGTAWVYNLADKTVTEIDARAARVRRTIHVRSIPMDANSMSGPVLAADEEGAWLVGIELENATGQFAPRGVITRIGAGGATRTFRVRYLPYAVAVGRGAVWILARGAQRAFVARADPATARILRRSPLPLDADPRGIAVGEGAVWVTEVKAGARAGRAPSPHPGDLYHPARLFRLDPESGRTTHTLNVGSSLAEDALVARPAAGLGSVWIASGTRGVHLGRVDPRTVRVVRTIESVPNREGEASVGFGSVWWNDKLGGSVMRMDDSGKLDAAVQVAPRNPRGDVAASTAVATGAGGVWATVGSSESHSPLSG